jgi:hypothetical protein
MKRWIALVAVLALAMPADATVPPALHVTTTDPIAGGANINLGGTLTLSCPTCAIYPTQTGNAGRYLTTNGTTVSWSTIGGTLPDQSSNSGKFLTTDGVSAAWHTLTQDDIAPAFSVSLSGPSSPVEVGANVVNPQFSVTRNQTPSVASLQDNLDTQSISPATLSALGYGGAANTFSARTYSYPGTLNSTRTWTYSATASGVTKTSNASVQWQPRVYYGIAVPGTINAAFITALSSSGLSASYPRTIAYSAGGGTQALYYAFPTSYGTPVSFKDTATGFSVPFSKVGSAVSVTNANGVVITYDVWASDNLLVNAVTVQVQ